MKEAKYRGFDKENNCWRYGFYTKMLEGARIFHAIIVEDEDAEYRFTRWYIHSAKTITQFTGKLDKYKEELFAGDKIQDETGFIVSIEWSDTLLTFQCFGKHSYRPLLCDLSMNLWQKIGSIHENPELLK